MSKSIWFPVVNHRISRRRALAVTGAAAGAVVLAACRVGKSGPSASGSATASSAAASSATATAAVKAFLDVPDPQIAVRGESVAPKDTDPEIDTALTPHYVAFSNTRARGRLFLFLSGTGGTPNLYRLVSDQAARNGFHVVNLAYPNADAVQNLCGLEPDTACFENARLETIYGTDRSTKVHVNRANSVENRLLKLLAYLAAKHPSEGWDTFIDGNAPKWSSTVVSGHSQGGGHAALIARDHVVARLAMFSAPVDHIGPNQRQTESSKPAPWLLGAHATPSERYYAFCHVQDENNDWELQWKALGLGLTNFGPIANVDAAVPPYGGSHLLTTDAQPRNPGSPNAHHTSIAVDPTTPLTQTGQPLFAPAWQYTAFA